MPKVTYTGDSGRYRVVNHTFTPGDTHTVGEEIGQYLADHESFEVVGDAGDEAVGQEDGPPDTDEWADWSQDAWLELDYQQRAGDVREGRVDDHLEEIADVETSETVTDAVDDRRDELEE